MSNVMEEIDEQLKKAKEESHKESIFNKEYKPVDSFLTKYVLETAGEEAADFHKAYSRLLLAFFSNKDSMFVSEFLTHGIATFPFYSKNNRLVIDFINIRTSSIRAICEKFKNLSIDDLVSANSSYVHLWAAEDIIKIHFKSYIPTKTMLKLMELNESITKELSK